MPSQASLFPEFVESQSPVGFSAQYADILGASGAREEFESDPSYSNARLLALSIYDAIHRSAPEGSRFALMSSAGKDSSAAVAYYFESVRICVAEGRRFIPGTVMFASTGHEFPEMERRVEKECAALNDYGRQFGCDARIVRPNARNTIMVELIGNGFALPPKATNDAVTAAGVANWCVSRVKTSLLDAATAEAAKIAPLVIQVLGGRHDEGASRSARMTKYGKDLPYGLCRVSMTSGSSFEESKFVGCYPIGHFTRHHIGQFIYSMDETPHRELSNVELESIYSRASEDGAEAGECSVMRGDDGKVLGGCSNLATGTRMGCAVCLKATNKALRNLARETPRIYSKLWMLQQEINRHQELVHARPRAVRASGFTSDEIFPRGFTFRTRYRWLVMLLAAEIESGFTQLTSDQVQWIERKWRRHGVLTVSVEDARKDARKWLREGGDVPCMFDGHDDFGDEFTLAAGEGIPLGAFEAHEDESQQDLNMVHLLGLNGFGGTMFPQLQTYVFEDLRSPNAFLCMVTDTPAVLGMKTSTGLINGLVGAALRCIAVRPPTDWEIKMGDGRHLFYHMTRGFASKALHKTIADFESATEPSITGWSLADFSTPTPDYSRIENFKRSQACNLEVILMQLDNGRCVEAFENYTLMSMSISQISGRMTAPRARALFRLVGELTHVSDALRDHSEMVFNQMRRDILQMTKGDWTLLAGDNSEGKELRRVLLRRAKEDGFDSVMEDYARYVVLLRRLERFRRAGLVNAPLVSRIAYATRTAIYDAKYAQQLVADLARLLKLDHAL